MIWNVIRYVEYFKIVNISFYHERNSIRTLLVQLKSPPQPPVDSIHRLYTYIYVYIMKR